MAFTWAAQSESAEMNSMSGKMFVDTNALIYAHDTDAGVKHEIAKTVLRDLWSERTGVPSVQVLQEFYANVTRKIPSPLSKDLARLVVRQLCSLVHGNDYN
jgi:predicted nucleic acid-binding protein